MTNKEQDYEQALKMIDYRLAQFLDVFEANSCDDIVSGPELTEKEILLMHLLDELSVLSVYGIKRAIAKKE